MASHFRTLRLWAIFTALLQLYLGTSWAFVSGACGRPPRGASSIRRAVVAGETVLLVDGDVQGAKQIQEAVELLKENGHKKVLLKVFSWPEMETNTQLVRVLKMHKGEFTAVPRAAPQDVDIAIVAEAKRLARSGAKRNIAFLTGDSGLAAAAKEIAQDVSSVWAIVPAHSAGCARFFQNAGAHTLHLSPGQLPKHVAVLLPDGTGQIQPFENFAALQDRVASLGVQVDLVRMKAILYERGFIPSTVSAPIPGIAKMWYLCRLGPLPIWPYPFAFRTVEDMLDTAGAIGQCGDAGALAYVLPVSSTAVGGKAFMEKHYGTTKCGQVVQGGGPFILIDSNEMPEQLLRRLGYLDNDLNSDFEEALSTFWSITNNKSLLAAMGCALSDAVGRDGRKIIRQALVSPSFSGELQLPIKPRALKYRFTLDGTLPKDASDLELMSCLKSYAKHHKLPERKTFNGLVTLVHQHLEQSPTKRRQ